VNSTDTARRAYYVVFATFATQMVVTMSNSTLPTIAPKLAEALGIEPALIGYQVSILFGGAAVGTLVGGSYSVTFFMLAIASAAGGALVLIARHGGRAGHRLA
jgi:hypothetical protein